MPRHFRTPTFALLLALSVTRTYAESPRDAANDNILERFAVAKGGDVLLLPVTVAGKERLFLLDTGCSHTVFDKTVDLGRPRETVLVNTPNGPAQVSVFDPPEGKVGKLPLRGLGPVGREDLSPLREATGYEIAGVLGMDFLGRHVVRIDFDKGEATFLKKAGRVANPSDKPIPIAWVPGAVPEVAAALRGREAIRFQIDTGHAGQCCGSLEADCLRRLVRDEELCKVGCESARTFTGVCEKAICRARRLTLGGFVVASPLLAEDGGANRLGLAFWSRFVVTFDFPGRAAYLSEGKGFDRKDRLNETGLGVVCRDGATVVGRVEGDSPAAKAGCKEGDVLLKVGGLVATKASLFEVRDALRSGPAACVVRRGQRQIELDLRKR